MTGKKLTIALTACALACFALGGCAPTAADASGSGSAAGTEQGAGGAAGKAQSAGKVEKKETKEVVTDQCVSCHPLDEVASASTEYLTESGETANPHRTVDADAPNPHEATGNEKAIDCGKCHTAHESDTPAADDIELPQNINYCYVQCHHQRTFEECSDCHNDR